MNCPICNFSELSEASAYCPACQSDLEVFGHLENVRKQHFLQKRSIAILVVLLAIAAVAWGTTLFMSNDETSSREAYVTDGNAAALLNKEKENDTLYAKITALNTEILSLQEKLNDSESSPTTNQSGQASRGTITHLVKEGESLWRIAAKYYKDGWQYKKIAEDNGITDPQSIRAGTELKINK